MDDAFGHWLAGFIDGEGCFQIAHEDRPRYKAPNRTYRCRFGIRLRDDDRPLLERILSETGLGKLYALKAGARNVGGVAAWEINSQADCVALIALLDRYPLRSKKAADLLVWREAVTYWASARGTRKAPRDWAPMAVFKSELESGRAYHAAAP